jgi:hypothetical protein
MPFKQNFGQGQWLHKPNSSPFFYNLVGQNFFFAKAKLGSTIHTFFPQKVIFRGKVRGISWKK